MRLPKAARGYLRVSQVIILNGSSWQCMLWICLASILRSIRGRGCGGRAIVTQSNALCISTSRLLQSPHRPHSQLSCTRGGEKGGPQVNLSRIGVVRLQRAKVALPRHGMEQNSQSMRRASVAQRWLYLRNCSECVSVALHVVNMLRRIRSCLTHAAQSRAIYK